MNFDIISNILRFTNVGYINLTLKCLALCSQHKVPLDVLEAARKHRLSRVAYFSNLVPDPRRLLGSMKESRTILIGQRATGYFSPNVIPDECPWDFYCNAHGPNAIRFVNSIFDMGAKLVRIDYDISNGTFFPLLDQTNLCAGLKFEMPYRGKSRINVILSYSASSLVHILDLEMSYLQCIITGEAAISIYHDFTKNDTSLWWKEQRLKLLNQRRMVNRSSIAEDGEFHKLMLSSSVTKSYGVDILSLSETSKSILDQTSTETQLHPYERSRYIRDDRCCTIAFDIQIGDFVPLEWTEFLLPSSPYLRDLHYGTVVEVESDSNESDMCLTFRENLISSQAAQWPMDYRNGTIERPTNFHSFVQALFSTEIETTYEF